MIEKNVKEKGQNYLWNSIDWISLSTLPEAQAKNVYKEYLDQQITLNEYMTWVASQPKVDLGLGIPAASVQAPQESKKEEKPAEKKEEKKVNFYFYNKQFLERSL